MNNPSDPRRTYVNSSFNFLNLAYAPSPESSQVSVGTPLEGNYVYVLPPQFSSQVPTPPSTTNSTLEVPNSHLVGTESASHYKGGEATAPASSPARAYSILNPMASPSQASLFDHNRGAAAAGASYAATYPNVQMTISPPSTPQLSTPPRHVPPPPPPHFLVSHAPSGQHTFVQQGGTTTPAAGQTFMLIAADSSAPPIGPFFSLPALPAPPAASAEMQSSVSASQGAAQIISPFGLTSPHPSPANVHGQMAYLMNPSPAGAVMSYPASPKHFFGFPNPTWTSVGSGGASAVTSPQQAHTYPSFATAGGGSVVQISSGDFSAPAPASPPSPTASHLANPPHSSSGTGAGGSGMAAAGESPGSSQPAALGVRSFMAPEPVGTCLIRDAPMIPIIPPLALPCPKWGKLPSTVSSLRRLGEAVWQSSDV